MMYEITLKYQDWFYASRLHRPDLFTALGTVLDSHEHTAVQWYHVRALVSEEGAPTPPEKAEATDLAMPVLSGIRLKKTNFFTDEEKISESADERKPDLQGLTWVQSE